MRGKHVKFDLEHGSGISSDRYSKRLDIVSALRAQYQKEYGLNSFVTVAVVSKTADLSINTAPEKLGEQEFDSAKQTTIKY